MAGKRKIIKKKLKQPDEFISFTEHGLRFVSRNYRWIIGGGVVLGVILAAFFLFQKWEEKREAEAHQLFAAAMERYQVLESPYREGASTDYKSLAEKFDEVITKFPRTASGRISFLYKGNLHLKLEEFDPAIKAYEAFLEKAGDEKIYRFFALEGLGYAHEGKKSYEKAIEAYQRMIEMGEGVQVANAHLNKGRCYEALGKKKEALESYKAFLELAPKGMMANLVSGKVSHLED